MWCNQFKIGTDFTRMSQHLDFPHFQHWVKKVYMWEYVGVLYLTWNMLFAKPSYKLWLQKLTSWSFRDLLLVHFQRKRQILQSFTFHSSARVSISNIFRSFEIRVIALAFHVPLLFLFWTISSPVWIHFGAAVVV